MGKNIFGEISFLLDTLINNINELIIIGLFPRYLKREVVIYIGCATELNVKMCWDAVPVIFL